MSETAEQTTEAPANDIETRARAMGWKPQEEYRGPAAGWRDAEEFVRRGETELPVIRERYRATERKLAEVSGQLTQATTVINDLTERFRTSDERAYKRAKADLTKERDAAIETGDKAAVHRVDAEIAEVERTAPKPAPAAPQPQPQAQPNAVHPDVLAWDARNPWYRQNPDMAEEAQAIHTRLLQREPNLTLTENLDRVTDAMRGLYPDRVATARLNRPMRTNGAAEADPPDPENPRRQEPAAVSGSSASRGPGRANPRSFDALPAESKAQFHRYAKQMESKPQWKPLTKEEWASTHFEMEDR